MKAYLDIVRHVLEQGQRRKNRTGIDAIGTFGYQYRLDLQKGFPLLTTKKIHYRSVFYELLWFLRGDTNIQYLHDHGVTIWDEWADSQGELGPVYGAQWRHWATDKGTFVDQIALIQQQLKDAPFSRRILLSSWNVGQLDQMALPPCHLLAQFYVANGRLSCQLYQRSADLFLGVPFNIASYALLTYLLAHSCGLKPGEFIHTLGDVHIYLNHLSAIHEQLTRTPRHLPELVIDADPKPVTEYDYDDFHLEGYDPWPTIKAQVAV